MLGVALIFHCYKESSVIILRLLIFLPGRPGRFQKAASPTAALWIQRVGALCLCALPREGVAPGWTSGDGGSTTSGPPSGSSGSLPAPLGGPLCDLGDQPFISRLLFRGHPMVWGAWLALCTLPLGRAQPSSGLRTEGTSHVLAKPAPGTAQVKGCY